MPLQPVLIDGAWRQSKSAGSFRAVDPTEKQAMPQEFPVSSLEEVEEALHAGYEAVVALRSLPVERIADFLEQYAANIEGRTDELVEIAHQETALPRAPRLRSGELPRTTDQLRQAAAAVRDRSWCLATIDPGVNIRSMYGPLNGPVAVFGPNNFPFAFNSAAGGDFTAAIAAGNPVIAKANTSHPETTRIFAEAAFEAVRTVGLPRAMVQLLYRIEPEVGLKLVSHPLIGATGFTGSRRAGLQLKEAADRAGKPIYLEMSSINPVYVLPGAIEERGDAIAQEFFASCTMGAGQFCTNPGVIVVMAGPASEEFLARAAHLFGSAGPGTLLGKRAPQDLAAAVQVLQRNGAEVVVGGAIADGPGYAFQNTILRVSGDRFIENPHGLQTEAFGAVSLMVFARDAEQMKALARRFEGNLTGAIYSDTGGSDDALYAQVEPELRPRVGRLLNDKMPTGVAVTPAMNHGGPYPATGHPGFTAVGIPAALLRFAALYSYDNVRQDRLPPELRDRNPTGRMWRLIDRAWTQKDVESPELTGGG
jgi:alpha-ketoglutaric semialdehyde dehydrogenase